MVRGSPLWGHRRPNADPVGAFSGHPRGAGATLAGAGTGGIAKTRGPTAGCWPRSSQLPRAIGRTVDSCSACRTRPSRRGVQPRSSLVARRGSPSRAPALAASKAALIRPREPMSSRGRAPASLTSLTGAAERSAGLALAESSVTMMADSPDFRLRVAKVCRGSWFCTDADCPDHLAWLRWTDGFVCPSCGVTPVGGDSLIAGSRALAVQTARRPRTGVLPRCVRQLPDS